MGRDDRMGMVVGAGSDASSLHAFPRPGASVMFAREAVDGVFTYGDVVDVYALPRIGGLGVDRPMGWPW